MKNIKAGEFIISIKTEILFKINFMCRKLYIYRLLAGVAVETFLVEMLLSRRERSVESPLGEQKDRSRIPITLSISCSSPAWLRKPKWKRLLCRLFASLDRDWSLFACVAAYFVYKTALFSLLAIIVDFLLYHRYSKCTIQWRIQGRGPGDPASLFLAPAEARRAEQKILRPSPLSQGLDDRLPLI